MPTVFTKSQADGWLPSELAQGPFAGLQGGAVAGLLVAEIEAVAAAEQLGHVVGVCVSFYRATPLETVRTALTRVKTGRRVSFIENTVMRDDGEVCARVRATLIQAATVDIPVFAAIPPTVDPASFPPREGLRAPHGKPWFMDTMQARVGPDGTAWFNPNFPLELQGGLDAAKVAGRSNDLA